jgi:CubicO group peptidase (beta-lactamase class C family)
MGPHLCNRGVQQALREKALPCRIRPGINKGNWYPGMGFGFNVEVKLDPAVLGYEVPALASPGAYGWGGAAYTRYWVDPVQDLIGIFMTQTRPTTGDLHQKFGNIVYGAIVSAPH